MRVVPFAIITTPPTSMLRAIHNRIPLIIPRDAYDEWLQGPDVPEHCIQPFNGKLELYPASTFVNNPRNDDPHCIVPA